MARQRKYVAHSGVAARSTPETPPRRCLGSSKPNVDHEAIHNTFQVGVDLNL